LADATTGAAIPSALDAFTNVADPSFSADGTKLAFASNTVGSYPVEYSHADLDVVDFNPATQTFSNRQTILDAGSDAVAFPSFSPDSQWVFYQRGDYSRAKYGANSIGHCNLYMIDVAGQGGQIALDNANGVGVLDASNLSLNYQPNANPVAVGGYYWIVFFSPRDYGNRMVSAGNPTYQNRKQLWVAAVDVNPQPGTDPSHPPFYLRGQDLATVNMKGYWALDPCKQEGNQCDAGYECCTGFCQPDGNGGFACSPPGACAQYGEACTVAADCCDPDALCVGGFCTPKPAN
jgi:Tol biopolymer transport system component